MRINESFSAPVSTGRTTGTSAAGSDTAAQSSSASAEDLVALSDASGFVSRALTSVSPERTARLQAIAAQVKAGSYNVSADALSESLVRGMMAGA
ncbi:MAG TPA: flagellar biosynthesis anti-sigma factor FlgM [Bryobacteraceae bacterium]|nr:flagellar biosynthesis anti-sigma factor FlgM [Bryobacteraceae bacterium]